MRIYKYGEDKGKKVPFWLFDWLDSHYRFTMSTSNHFWNSESVFCAVPHVRNIGDWVRKAYRESQKDKTVVLLLPVRTDTAWFHEYVSMASAVYFLRGRVEVVEHGKVIGKWGFPHMVVVFDNNDNGQVMRYVNTKPIKEKYEV